MRRSLEVCVEDIAGVEAAVAGGADRIELCAALAVGGLTPPASLIAAAAKAPIPVHLLARPRDGNFVYTAAEAGLVAADIRAASEAGLAGVVIGASCVDHHLDAEVLAAWIAVARSGSRPLSLTLHRAFDLCPDPVASLETAIALGFDRILTSGCTPKAIDGREMLAKLVAAAGDRLTILAGSGVDATTLPPILNTGVREVHASCRSPQETANAREIAFGFQTGPRLATDAKKVRALRKLLDAQASA
ncbi:copper homeostasis protein CutC [Sphingomonas sp. TDK1]|uniref:copper homeostasis protein CutC n=1 Tax=Sphingomonas sp. TDK1 TaxID=453247 RepID=UPI0007D96648|nr:copper homeostasis protein CutC [Sphingomonas sp. TDK1]OAN67216.1 copper homeostasis protein CutC [Sphingomonas sp. TDK1]